MNLKSLAFQRTGYERCVSHASDRLSLSFISDVADATKVRLIAFRALKRTAKLNRSLTRQKYKNLVYRALGIYFSRLPG